MNSFAAQIKERVSLVDVLSRYGLETQKGKMCCPFHSEKTASFTVFDNDTYYCFGCGASGDVIRFVQDLLKCDFMTAVKQIDGDFGLFLFDKPTLTQKRRIDKHIAELEKARQERQERARERIVNYWSAYDEVLFLKRLLKEFKPDSPEEKPSLLFTFALQNIGPAEHKLNIADIERRLADD